MAQPHRNDDGFTLLEALVVLAIVAAILAFTPAALSLGQRALQLVADVDQHSREQQSLGAFEERLSAAQQIYETGANGIAVLQFQGEEDRLRFVTEFTGGPYGGGLYAAEVGTDPAAPAVVLTVRPHMKQPALQQSTRSPLVHANRLSFRYYGPDQSGGNSWQPKWQNQKRLPNLIAYTISSEDRASAMTGVVTLRLSQ